MLQDRVKKKRKASPGNGGGDDAQSLDLAKLVPDVKDVNKDILEALKGATRLQSALQTSLNEKNRGYRSCVCG